MIAPSGKGSVPARYALIAASLPSTAAKLFRLASSWATEISFQSRYPAGILVMKIADPSAAVCEDAEAMNATAPPAIATPTKYEPMGLIAASWLLLSSDTSQPNILRDKT